MISALFALLCLRGVAGAICSQDSSIEQPDVKELCKFKITCPQVKALEALRDSCDGIRHWTSGADKFIAALKKQPIIVFPDDPTRYVWNFSKENNICKWPGVTCAERCEVTEINLEAYGYEAGVHHAYAIAAATYGKEYGSGAFVSDAEFIPTYHVSELTKTEYINGLKSRPFAARCDVTKLANIDWKMQLPALRKFKASDTMSYGTLVTSSKATLIGQMAQATALDEIHLENNKITGHLLPFRVPGEAKSNLAIIRLSKNLLTGTIPDFYQDLQSLVELRLQGNTLSGKIPSNLFNRNEQLEYLDLTGNQLTGKFPLPIKDFNTKLQQLHLGNNKLTGTLPANLFEMSSIVVLNMHNNSLTGPLPNLTASNSKWDKKINTFDLSGAGMLFDCPLPKDATGMFDKINCACRKGSYTKTKPAEPKNSPTACTTRDYVNAPDTDTIPTGLWSENDDTLKKTCLETQRYTCTLCEAGKYSIRDWTWPKCVDCLEGTYSSQGAVHCTNCVPSKYSDVKGAPSCKQCPPGRVTSTPGTIQCTTCPAGKYSNLGRDRCLSCNQGQFQTADGKTKCGKCLAGKIAASRGQIVCDPCAPNLYQPKTGQLSCAPCLDGHMPTKQNCADGSMPTDSDKQGSFKKCSDGTLAGKPGTNCTACVVGKYAASGDEICKSCLHGQFSNQRASKTCSPCPAGKYSSLGASVCLDCSVNYFSSSSGAYACSVCAEGKWSPRSATVCTSCDDSSLANASGRCTTTSTTTTKAPTTINLFGMNLDISRHTMIIILIAVAAVIVLAIMVLIAALIIRHMRRRAEIDHLAVNQMMLVGHSIKSTNKHTKKPRTIQVVPETKKDDEIF